MLVLLDNCDVTLLIGTPFPGESFMGESLLGPRFSASSWALRLLMPPAVDWGRSAGLLVTLGSPERTGPKRGVVARE